MEHTRPSWDEYYLELCNVIKKRSTDPNRQVGSILVEIESNLVMGMGYNGLVSKSNDNIDWKDRELVHSVVLHAEMNCILHSNKSNNPLKMYITTSPCINCLKIIAASNIKKIIFIEKYKDFDNVKKVCDFYGIEILQINF